MSDAYRKPGALDLVPPEAGSPWWEELAWAITLAHQPARARAKRETAPPHDLLKVLELAARHFMPTCRVHNRKVERVAFRREAFDLRIVAVAWCGGVAEHQWFIEERPLLIAGAAGPEASANALHAVLARPLGVAPVRRFERFDDPRDGYAEGFEATTVRTETGVDALVAAVMVKTEE